MALDAQSNWDVAMSQPVKLSTQTPTRTNMQSSPRASPPIRPAREIPLPTEIISQIISYVPSRASSQPALWACALVSRSWYSAVIARLYTSPHLTPANFSLFVSTICPSKNAHIRRTPLSQLVSRLDMSELVHDSSRSLTARLLGRLKGNLEEFVAPQSSFAINSFPALSKCANLRLLNLSLVSAPVDIGQLSNTLATLNNLETLFFRSSQSSQYPSQPRQAQPNFTWPPKLKALHVAGDIQNPLPLGTLPPTLERLHIQHCPLLYNAGLMEILEPLGSHLKHLTICHPMRKMFVSALDDVLIWCPSLTTLRISADYISSALFEEGILGGHPLQILHLDCSPTVGPEVAIDPDSIFIAVEEGRLPDLRCVRVNARLAWSATETSRRDTEDLGDLLEALEKTKPLGIASGVYIVSDS